MYYIFIINSSEEQLKYMSMQTIYNQKCIYPNLQSHGPCKGDGSLTRIPLSLTNFSFYPKLYYSLYS